MTGYSVPCGVHATDNDHFKLAELSYIITD